MKLQAEIANRSHDVDATRSGDSFSAVVDGRAISGELRRPEPGVYLFVVDARVVEVRVSELSAGVLRVRIGPLGREIRIIDRKHRQPGSDVSADGVQTLVAPMPGRIVAILASVGDHLAKGEGVLVVEAMKMQNEVRAAKAGIVADIRVAVGDIVNAGQPLATIA